MRLSLKAKVLSLAVLPVLLFAVVISLTTVWILKEQARTEVPAPLNNAKATLQSYVEVAMTTIKPLYDAAAPGDTEARAQVVKLLSNTTYGKDGFGYDSETIRLFKGNSPDGVGKSFKDNLRPLHLMKANLDDIAAGEGDLTRRLAITSQDELGELAGSFNRFVDKIHGLVRQITDMTSQLTGLVSQVSEQAHRSEQAMERQRQETDQVATAINEMSSAAHEVARSAQGAAVAAQQTDAEGQAAKRVVDGSIAQIHALVNDIRSSGVSLDSLQQDVSSIVSVLGVIRSIAEQTNLLALNAAIEAARAGEAGRGFAVVADEVRALASRTQQSTQEIQGMIDRLQKGTEAAVESMRRSSDAGDGTSAQANEAGASLDTMAQLIGTINTMNAQIASAAEEQTAVAEEINRSVHQIAVAVDSVADETQQGAQTSRSLAELGQRLGQLVGQFRI
jgi:methyl-accepting chemotaxis protein